VAREKAQAKPNWISYKESFMEFKRSSSTKTLEALEENKKCDEDLSTKKCLDELNTTDGLTDGDISYAMDAFEYVVNRGVYEMKKPEC
jgi:hypothetical protein